MCRSRFKGDSPRKPTASGFRDRGSRRGPQALTEAGKIAHGPRIRSLLYRATRDRAHLAEAKRFLDEALSKIAQAYHDAMLTKVKRHRDIMKALSEQAAS